MAHLDGNHHLTLSLGPAQEEVDALRALLLAI